MAHATVLNYRALDKAFPEAEFGAPNCPAGVALAFIALDDRKALVSREEPWTVAEARAFVAERELAAREKSRTLETSPAGKRGRGRPRKPPRSPQSPQPSLRNADLARASRPGAEPAGPVSPFVATDPGPAARKPPAGRDPEPRVPGLAELKAENARLAAESAGLTVKLTAAEQEIARLKAAHPDVVQAEEIKVLTAQRDALRGEVAGLKAELADALSAAERDGLDADSLTETEAADSAGGGGQGPSGPCANQNCGRPGTPFLYDGEEQTGRFICDRCFARASARDELLSRRVA